MNEIPTFELLCRMQRTNSSLLKPVMGGLVCCFRWRPPWSGNQCFSSFSEGFGPEHMGFDPTPAAATTFAKPRSTALREVAVLKDDREDGGFAVDREVRSVLSDKYSTWKN